MVGSTHCLAFVGDPASDPTKIHPFNDWQVALGENQGTKFILALKYIQSSKPGGNFVCPGFRGNQ